MEQYSIPDLVDQINKQKWFLDEYKNQMKRFEKVNKITFNLPKNQLITLNSPILTPELKVIATSMYIPNISKIAHVNMKTWSAPNSNSHSIALSLGGWGAVESVIQLPTKSKRPDSTIIFSSIAARKAAQYNVKNTFGQKAPNIQYSLNNFPKLKFQVRCLNNIFKELMAEKSIIKYNLNNFAACNYNEFLFPLYSFKLEGNSHNSKFNDSRCASLYQNGFSVPSDDFLFQSKEYQELKTIIQDHVYESTELSSKPSNPTLHDYFKFVCPDATVNIEGIRTSSYTFSPTFSQHNSQASPVSPLAPAPPTAPPTEDFPSLPSSTHTITSCSNSINNISGIKESGENKSTFIESSNNIKINNIHSDKTYLVYKSDYEFQSPIDLLSLMPYMSPMIGNEVVKTCSPSNLYSNPSNSPNKSMTNLVPVRLDFSN